MLMICWFYCIPFSKGLFFAASLLLLLFSVFMLKRGVRQSRSSLRSSAFILMFLAALKIFTIDLYLLSDKILCDTAIIASRCAPTGFKVLMGGGFLAVVLIAALLLNAYRSFVYDRRQVQQRPEDVRLSLWVNIGLSLVVLLIIWLIMPWVGYLTVGSVPALVQHIPWQYLAIAIVAVLLICFWKLEDCSWVYHVEGRGKKAQVTRAWTAKDTLWVATLLFAIALVFSYVSMDVLSSRPSTPSQSHFDWRDLFQGSIFFDKR